MNREFDVPYETYLERVAQTKFVLAPRGSGEDTHRPWEALVLGSFPIVRTSALDSLFEGLPGLLVSEWDEVSSDLLDRTFKVFKSQNYNMSKLFLPFWLGKIKEHGKMLKRM